MKIKKHLLLVLSGVILASCAVKDKKEIQPEVKKVEEVHQQVKDDVVVKEPVISFEVQIGAFDTRNTSFAGIENIKEIVEDSLYKYRLGSFEKYRKARKYRRSLLKKYPDAFVQALKDGKPITIKEALKN